MMQYNNTNNKIDIFFNIFYFHENKQYTSDKKNEMNRALGYVCAHTG